MEALKLIQNCLNIEIDYFNQFGQEWKEQFIGDILHFSFATIELQHDFTEKDNQIVYNLLNLSDDYIPDTLYIFSGKMTENEMRQWSSSDIPKSFTFLIKTIDISVAKNDGLCRIYLMMCSLIGACLFEMLECTNSLDAVKYFGKRIRYLENYLNSHVDDDKKSSSDPIDIYLSINGKSFSEVFDENCEIITSNINTNDDSPIFDDNINKNLNDSLDDKLKKDLSELNNLIGLSDVKKQVRTLINLALVQKERDKRNLKSFSMSQHLVFIGNPGTGKTTVARLIGNIYHDIGILSKGHVVEVDRSDLIAEYVGQTAIKTQKVINSALGGVLFIDEAYSVVSDSSNDFGNEAITILLKEMEDNRNDLVVIVAGYPNEMNKFINSNPGLKSRFKKTINFNDYNSAELVQIFENYCTDNGYNINSEMKSKLSLIFQNEINKKDKNFANARFARNLFEKAVENQANRIIADGIITEDELAELIIEDLTMK